MDTLPFSQACENNKAPILAVLAEVFADRSQVLEIASGTGQHATWFAGHLAHLQWQPTELAQHLPVLEPRCKAYDGENLLSPRALDVSQRPWLGEAQAGAPQPDALFSANSLHIMPWASVQDFYAELGERAVDDVLLAIYGPFNYGGHYTSDSNARLRSMAGAAEPLERHSRFRGSRRPGRGGGLCPATGF